MATRVILAACLVIAACAQQPAQTGKARVVSLVPSVTEIIYALGAERQLAGNCNQCDFPAAAKQVYKVGDFLNPDVERILALGPTLVLATLPVQQRTADALRGLGVPVYVSQPADIAAVLAEIDSVGRLVGAADAARRLVADLGARLDSIPAYADTPRVYVEISSTPLMTAGASSFINGLVERAGGRNAFADAVQEYPVIDGEMVAIRDPQVILLLHPDVRAGEVARRIGWPGISAVKSGRVYDSIDEDLLFRPGPRIVDGIELLARLLHPGH